MPMYLKLILAAAAVVAIIVIAGAGAHTHESGVEIIDGDTFVYEGETIRLIGIDTPESVDPDEPVQCGALDAKAKLTELLADAEIEIRPGVEHTDAYGRTLAYVYADGAFVNAALARTGYARYYDFEPNTKFAPVFHRLVYEAIDDQRGVWGECPDAMRWATGGSS